MVVGGAGVDDPAHELAAAVAAREPAAAAEREVHVAARLEQFEADLAAGLTAPTMSTAPSGRSPGLR
jgi:hypothetical protein